MVKVQQTPNKQLIITIPKRIADFKGIVKGMEVVFREHGKHTLTLELLRDHEKKNSQKVREKKR